MEVEDYFVCFFCIQFTSWRWFKKSKWPGKKRHLRLLHRTQLSVIVCPYLMEFSSLCIPVILSLWWVLMMYLLVTSGIPSHPCCHGHEYFISRYLAKMLGFHILGDYWHLRYFLYVGMWRYTIQAHTRWYILSTSPLLFSLLVYL